MASMGIISGDTNGWRTSEVRHPFVSPEIMPIDAMASSYSIYATTPRHGQLHQPRHYATPHRAYPLANERHPRVAESKE
ncbi:MAG: hypothetical protein E5299_00332 [Burkholderia gladioli]|nr:MAG: hypothetical protein E5299_00332 [Burkholderia gladioli]